MTQREREEWGMSGYWVAGSGLPARKNDLPMQKIQDKKRIFAKRNIKEDNPI